MSADCQNALEVETRPARIEDAASVARLLGQLGYERTPDEVAHGIETSATNPAIHILVAALPEGTIVGCLQTFVTCRLAEGDRGEIASLAVDADWRGRRIGTRLVQKAVEQLRAQGIRDLRVRCNIKRKRAHRFYERFGFQRTKTQTVFDLPVQPRTGSPNAI